MVLNGGLNIPLKRSNELILSLTVLVVGMVVLLAGSLLALQSDREEREEIEREEDLDRFVPDLVDAYSPGSDSLDLQLFLSDPSLGADLESREGRTAVITLELMDGDQWTVTIPEDSTSEGETSSATIPVSVERGDGKVEIGTMEVVLHG